MGRFNGIKLTNKGLRLQAKAQTGTVLSFKKIVVGSGHLPDNTDVTAMTSLISPIDDVHTDIISNIVTGDGYSQLEARITSGTTAFYLREIGIIATDPDEGDILYAYTNAGDYADFIPAAVDNVTTQDIVLTTAIGNAENVEVNITLADEMKRYSQTPIQIGTWYDGTPIWRVAFKKEFEASDAIWTDKMMTVGEALDVVLNTAYCFVIDEAVRIYSVTPCAIDDQTCNYNGGAWHWVANNSGQWTGFYGWVEFATPKTNLKVV